MSGVSLIMADVGIEFKKPFGLTDPSIAADDFSKSELWFNLQTWKMIDDKRVIIAIIKRVWFVFLIIKTEESIAIPEEVVIKLKV